MCGKQRGHVKTKAFFLFGLVDHETDESSGAVDAAAQVVLDNLRGAEVETLLLPQLPPHPRRRLAGKHQRVRVFTQSGNRANRAELLLDERACGRHEYGLAAWEPAEEVADRHRADQRLPKTRGDRNQRVVKESRAAD